MTVHHLICEEELLQKCLYCGRVFDLNNWRSNFHLRKHYKELKCTCGKLNKITVCFEGSGHDMWIKEIRLNNIEDKVNGK